MSYKAVVISRDLLVRMINAAWDRDNDQLEALVKKYEENEKTRLSGV